MYAHWEADPSGHAGPRCFWYISLIYQKQGVSQSELARRVGVRP